MSVAISNQLAPSSAVAEFLRKGPRLFIGGEWVEPRSDKTVSVVDPATGYEIATTADAGEADVDRAVKAARYALEEGPWSTMLPSQREALIWRLADLIDQHADELAELESIDNGKTKFMANIVDIPGSRDYFRYMAGWATKIEGSTIDISVPAREGGRVSAYTLREPVGVVAPEALGGADLAVVPKIADVTKVAADERLDPEKLIKDVQATGSEAWYLESVEEIARHVAGRAEAGDVVAVLSNGGFGGLHNMLLEQLAARS